MKYIVSIIIVLILNVNYVAAQAVMQPKQDATLSSLEATHISQQDKVAYEKLAIQTFKDVLDYIQLVATVDLPLEMRQAAKDEVLRHIVSHQMQPTSWLLLSKNKKKQTTQKLVEQLIKASNNYQLQYQNIQFVEPLESKSPKKYTGKLTYEQKLSGEKTFRKINITVNLTKVTKVFGTEEIEVWQVHFGEVSYE